MVLIPRRSRRRRGKAAHCGPEAKRGGGNDAEEDAEENEPDDLANRRRERIQAIADASLRALHAVAAVTSTVVVVVRDGVYVGSVGVRRRVRVRARVAEKIIIVIVIAKDAVASVVAASVVVASVVVASVVC